MPVRLYRKKSKADVRPPEDSSRKNSLGSLQTSPSLPDTPPTPTEASPRSSSRTNEAGHPPAVSSSSSSSSSPKMARSASQARATRVTRGSNSEDSTMEDFWREVEHIEGCQNQEAIVIVRTPEEGELEAEWLHAAGLAVLVSEVSGSPAPSCRTSGQSTPSPPSPAPCASEDGDADGRTLFSTLTRAQAAAVARRLDTYTQTVRRRRHRPSARDVRDVFPASACAEQGLDNGTSRPPEGNQSTEQPSANSTPPADSKTTEKKNGALSSEPCTLSAQEAAEVADLQSDVPYSDQAASCCQSSTIAEEENAISAGVPCSQHPCLGTTRLDDLSAQDMKKIRFLALIELTALLDALTIDLKRSKAIRTKVKENGLFGVSLPVVLEQDQRKFPGTRVPIFLHKLLCHLEETSLNAEGILRVPGSAARIKALLEFLRRVCENERENRMSLRNVAMVMAPNLFLPRGHQRGGQTSDQRHVMQAGAGIVGVTRLLIKHQDLLWTVPAFLLRQIRDVYEAQKRKPVREKSMRKLLKKGSSEKERQPQDRQPRETIHSEVPEGIIRVQAPRLLKVSMAIQLTEQITAGDIVERFQSNLSHASNGAPQESDIEEHRLYEVGGNIGERRLDNQTCMLALYRVNPHAEWVIKPRGLPAPNAVC
uniref:Rho GTPase-activating protein 28-like isoform X4 n=1 Tax=Petromyzon marinus TaxID=7757 RepID=A0AAJ7SZY9_PETMA|nr:rho GTPase-activating protein 28-like isoform X4 [Petromyzon marinus]